MFATTYLLTTGDQLRLRGISCFADQENTQVRFVYGGSVSSTGDQFRLRGISCFRKVAWTAGKTGRTGAAVGCDAARPAARRRVGEPAASAERERRGRQRRCLRLLTYLLRGISCVYGGSVVSPTKKIHKFVLSTGDQFRLRGISFVYGGSVVFERLPGRQEKRAGPARPSGAMRPGRPPGAGSVSRRRRPNARDGGGSADVCVYLLTSSFCLRGISFVYGGSVVSPTKKIHKFVLSTGDQFRLRGISFVYGGSVVFERLPGRQETGRTGAAVGCDAARPAARRRVGEPAASAERERRGRQRRCLRLLTYKFFLSTGDQFRLRGISCFADQENTQVRFVYGGSVSSTGDQFRLRGISCFRKVAWTAGKTGRTGAAVGCDAARPAARRRVGEPAASAERERRGRQRRCLRLLTYKFFLSTGDQFRLRGISCFPTKKIHKFVLSTGDQFRLRGISCFVYGGSVASTGDQLFRRPRKYTSSFCLRGISFVYGGSVSSTGDQLFSKGCLDGRKNGPDRRGRRVRCGPAGRPAPGR